MPLRRFAICFTRRSLLDSARIVDFVPEPLRKAMLSPLSECGGRTVRPGGPDGGSSEAHVPASPAQPVRLAESLGAPSRSRTKNAIA